MNVINWIRRNCPRTIWPFARQCLLKMRFLKYKFANFLSSDILYYCPCCGSHLTAFVSGTFISRSNCFNPARYMNSRQDVLCPVCLSLPRHRILAAWCETYKDSLHGKRVLYFALEKGMECCLRRNKVLLTSADLYDIADLKLDLMCIDQPDNSWDLVFCNHVLEHVKDYRIALSELYRILRPCGRLICSFPIDDSYETVYEDGNLVSVVSPEADMQRIQKFGQKDHLRVFGRDSIKLLETAGFIVTVIDGDTMPEEIMPVVGPADYDSNKLFICEKKE